MQVPAHFLGIPGLTAGSGGIIGVLLSILAAIVIVWIRIQPAMKKLKLQADETLVSNLLTRLSAVEKSQSEQQRAHSDELSALKRQHSDELSTLKNQHAEAVTEIRNSMSDQFRKCEEENRELHVQVDGLRRMIIAWQVTSGQAMPLHLPPETQKMVDRIAEMLSDNPEKRSIFSRIPRPRRRKKENPNV